MLYDFPAPVCPYANGDELNPPYALFSTILPKPSYTIFWSAYPAGAGSPEPSGEQYPSGPAVNLSCE